MNTHELIEKLGYKDNPAFLHGPRLEEHHGYSFFFDQARKKDHCNLEGVYALVDSPDNSVSQGSLTPIVYACYADTETQAAKIHHRVWNQNIVPFLIVVTRSNIRLYPGFEYDRDKGDDQRVLELVTNANEILDKLSAFTSRSIDSGDIWEHQRVSIENRVDRHLLANLKKLSEVLTCRYNLSLEHAHNLIGKYIYLKYLRDRGILSDQKLSEAGVSEKDIFSRHARKDRLYQLEQFLDVFLNGTVFPLRGTNNIREDHIRQVAGTFTGDDPESGQQVFFDIYDFSYVPIETLSVVYQQFIHQKGQQKEKGAYYTPVHLVNFMLDELSAKKPLKEGMKVFDPSCGSGAFLVQCYRRLVESVRRTQSKLNPTKLRTLLIDHIFGLDADKEACLVAELSLSLTLLDYIEPPDLKTYPTFKLPKLHNKNIFHCEGGFFDDESLWAKSIPKKSCDWVVGNPPWKNLGKLKTESDKNAAYWIKKNINKYPTDNYQLSEAFAWKTTELLANDGQCALLMPAMTLFKTQAENFRSAFFSNVEVWCIVNFANLRRSLFEEAVNPAAAFFFSGKKDWARTRHYITTYAPFAVQQPPQLNQKGKPKKIWAVFINYSAVREIPLRDIESGSCIPWKIAMWGTHRDSKVISLISKHNFTLEKFLNNANINIAEGSQLRVLPEFKSPEEEKDFYEKHEYLTDLVGKGKVSTKTLKKYIKASKIALQFPGEAIVETKENEVYLRKRGGKAGLLVSNPPHIIIAASRKHILYSDDFAFVPPRQIGISGNPQHSSLLKSLTLYLNSNFVHYQQLLTGEALGVERDCVNLDSLKQIPVPFSSLTKKDFLEWSNLYDEIVEAEKREREAHQDSHIPLIPSRRRASPQSLSILLRQMNEKVYNLLGITKTQQWLIEDTLNVRMKLNDGILAKEAIRRATEKEITDFARIFQNELDEFLDHTGTGRVHKVKVYYADNTAVIIVDHLKRSTATQPETVEVRDSRTIQQFDTLQDKLTVQRSQWIYFSRCLRIYENRRTYIFKPRQRLYWLKSQALLEADEFIAEKLGAE